MRKMAFLQSVRRTHLIAVLLLSAVAGIVAAGVNTGRIQLSPPGLGPGDLSTSAAVTHVMVDVPGPGRSVVQKRALPQHLYGLVKHTELLGRVLVSQPVLDDIAHRMGIPADRLSGLGRTTADVPLALSEPVSERRASDIRDSRAPYRLEVEGRPTTPVLDVYAQAPTTPEAEQLANVAFAALQQYVDTLGTANGTAADTLVRLRQLGVARGGVVNGGDAMTIAALTFLTAFALCCTLLLGLLRRRARRRGELPLPAAPAPGPAEPTDMWPHTTRMLPWMLAGFIALLWLLPFNSTTLNMSAPIELRLDRLVLPFILGLWVLAIAAGGRGAPRWRWSIVHTALCTFLLVACLSVVLDARYLNHTLEIGLAVKKLPLLISYVLMFIVVASAVRRGEVRAFLTYSLAMAVITALGMIIEYRFKQNLFYSWTDKVLPSVFSVDGQLDASAVDELGRRIVRGPAEAPLEAVTMLTMALPIAVVRLMQPGTWLKRLAYAIAIGAIVAATFATYRKSALLAPVSVILTLAYFRRRELLRLAPLGLVLLVLVSVLSPGAIASTLSQFTRSDRSDVSTVSDRASDYDAVRPDVFSHFAFGRGIGTYNHVDYRILDSEVLGTTIEIGVVGLIAYLLIPLSVIVAARKSIRRRDAERSPVTLMGAACAVAFLVVSFLFDVMSFPHAGYIFLYVAALMTVTLDRRGEAAEPTDERGASRAPRPPRRAPSAHAPVREPAVGVGAGD